MSTAPKLALALLLLPAIAVADTTTQPLPFTQNWDSDALITANDDWSGVPGILGFRGDGLTTATAVDPQTVLGEGTPVLDVIANQTSPGSTGGVIEVEGAPTQVALQGSGTADAPYLQIAVATTGVASVRVRYTLTDLDGSADNAVQPVALQYRAGNTGDFINVPAAFIADASEGPSLSGKTNNIDVTLPADAGNLALLQIRIITTDAAGADEAIGIDSISIASASTSPTAVGAVDPSAQIAGGAITITATVTPGSGPTSTGLAVTCDLTGIGGTAGTALVDDGTGADVTAGDNVFTLATTIAAGTATGAKSLPCDVTDAQARTTSFTAAVTVSVVSVCGDGVPEGLEECDDGGTGGGDGCSATCTEEPGFDCTGTPSTCNDVDECTDNLDDCDANATCTNTPGSFSCACNEGFTGTGTTCEDDDECTLATDNCDANATCTNTVGSFTCACNEGFTGSGTACTDDDECTLATDNCDDNATCTNTPGAFTCACNAGFSGDGESCADVDECDAETADCDANAACTNTTGGFTCACNPGFTGDGTSCADIDECDTANTCDPNATCMNTAGGFECECNDGFEGDGDDCTISDGDDGGCCSSSSDPSGAILFGLFALVGIFRRRR